MSVNCVRDGVADLAQLVCSVLDGQDCELGGSRVACYLYHIRSGFRRQGVNFGRNQKILHLDGIKAEFSTVLLSLHSREREREILSNMRIRVVL